MQEIEYVEDLRGAEERVLRAVHGLSTVLEREALPEDPPPPYEEFLADLEAQPSYVKPHYWLLWGDDRALAGSARFRARYREDNRHIGRVSVELHPKHRGKGVSPRLLLPAVEAAAADARTLIQGYTYEGGPGEGFAEKLGAKLAISEAHNRLTLSDVDRPMLEDWVAKAPERASEYSLLFWEGPCPDERVDRFAELKHVMNTAPMSDSWEDEVFTPEMLTEEDALAQKAGWVPWNYVAVHEPTGEWGGYTRLFPGVFRPQFAYQ
ncbi:MAG: GNAT family N-acetyltransferase, partial [Actinomycetota bacterium]